MNATDPHVPLEDNAWRELAEIDAKLERGDIDERGRHEAAAAIFVPAYLAADTPWGQSTWEPSRVFTYVRTGLDYVSPRRRPELVERLLGFSEWVLVGVFNEHETERTTEALLASWGFEVAGRSVRKNRWKPGMEYRVLWVDR